MSFATRVSQVKQWQGLAALMLALTPLAASGQAPTEALPLTARAKGSATAPVTVYEMADFQCPYCRNFATQTFDSIVTEFIKPGKVRWIFINLPIPSLHANAEAAAEFAVCAAVQGRFWPAHDMLYRAQEQWEALKDPAPFFQSKSASLGLKADEMSGCLRSGRGTAMVKDDATGAARSGVSSTPSFYIEGGIISGAQPMSVFRPILDSIWKAKSKK